jgi:hypothetical protein
MLNQNQNQNQNKSKNKYTNNRLDEHYFFKVESKLFYHYGEAGYKVLAQLKNYLNSLDFVDIYFLLAGTNQDTFFYRIFNYKTQIEKRGYFTYSFDYKEFEFKLTIKKVQSSNKSNKSNKLDKKEQITIQHNVVFEIAQKSGVELQVPEQILKHQVKTKFVVKRLNALSFVKSYEPLAPSEFFICVKPKPTAADFNQNPFRWLYILMLSNEKELLEHLEHL